jgi:hypothetical protein
MLLQERRLRNKVFEKRRFGKVKVKRLSRKTVKPQFAFCSNADDFGNSKKYVHGLPELSKKLNFLMLQLK